MNRCVDPLDPPVRTLEDLRREEQQRIVRLRKLDTLHGSAGPRTRPVYSDHGENWPSLAAAAAALGVTLGGASSQFYSGGTIAGRKLSYAPFLKRKRKGVA